MPTSSTPGQPSSIARAQASSVSPPRSVSRWIRTTPACLQSHHPQGRDEPLTPIRLTESKHLQGSCCCSRDTARLPPDSGLPYLLLARDCSRSPALVRRDRTPQRQQPILHVLDEWLMAPGPELPAGLEHAAQ